jgi:uncharacterized protein YcbX
MLATTVTAIRIQSLHRYPIKGCRAIDVDSLQLRAGKVVGDRTLMLIDAATGRFISQRHVPGLARLVIDALSQAAVFDGETFDLSRLREAGRCSVNVWDDTFVAAHLGDEPASVFTRWVGKSV